MKHSTARIHFLTCAFFTALLFLFPVANAHFPTVWEPVPIARLVRNVHRYVTKHPKDARGHYTLGRIHSMAFSRQAAEIKVTENDWRTKKPLSLPEFPVYESVQVQMPGRRPNLTTSMKKHLTECLVHYRRAVELAPDNGLYNLGLAWMLENAAQFEPQVRASVGAMIGTSKPGTWKAQALALYRRAFRLNRDRDLKEGGVSGVGDGFVSVEAGEGILRLTGTDQQPPVLKERDAIRDHIKKVGEVPRAVTPIIFALNAAAPFSSLVTSARSVPFDLGATGRKRSWPWVTTEAGILVWDPEIKGHITSGSQLFGSRTWQMFWRNGYEPLNALDNNGDGQLTGRELIGISVWRDRNVNGRSERGEVTPAYRLGIAAIATRPTGQTDGVPSASEGLRIRGNWVPTYDWTPTSR